MEHTANGSGFTTPHSNVCRMHAWALGPPGADSIRAYPPGFPPDGSKVIVHPAGTDTAQPLPPDSKSPLTIWPAARLGRISAPSTLAMNRGRIVASDHAVVPSKRNDTTPFNSSGMRCLDS